MISILNPTNMAMVRQSQRRGNRRRLFPLLHIRRWSGRDNHRLLPTLSPTKSILSGAFAIFHRLCGGFAFGPHSMRAEIDRTPEQARSAHIRLLHRLRQGRAHGLRQNEHTEHRNQRQTPEHHQRQRVAVELQLHDDRPEVGEEIGHGAGEHRTLHPDDGGEGLVHEKFPGDVGGGDEDARDEKDGDDAPVKVGIGGKGQGEDAGEEGEHEGEHDADAAAEFVADEPGEAAAGDFDQVADEVGEVLVGGEDVGREGAQPVVADLQRDHEVGEEDGLAQHGRRGPEPDPGAAPIAKETRLADRRAVEGIHFLRKKRTTSRKQNAINFRSARLRKRNSLKMGK